MSEEEPAVAGGEKQPTEVPDATPEVVKSEKPPESIPYNRFQEVNKEKKNLEQKLADYEAQAEKQRQAQLTEEQRIKEENEKLKGELETKSRAAQEWEEYKAAKRDDLFSKLDESERELLADADIKIIEHLVEAKQASRGMSDPSRVGSFGGYDTEVELATKDPKAYEKFLRAGKNDGAIVATK